MENTMDHPILFYFIFSNENWIEWIVKTLTCVQTYARPHCQEHHIHVYWSHSFTKLIYKPQWSTLNMCMYLLWKTTWCGPHYIQSWKLLWIFQNQCGPKEFSRPWRIFHMEYTIVCGCSLIYISWFDTYIWLACG